MIGVSDRLGNKLFRSDVVKLLPDGSKVRERVSCLDNRTTTYNPDGSMTETKSAPFSGLITKFMESGRNIGIHYLFIFTGAGIGLYFVLRGLIPIFISLRKNK
ncbi:MAG: hypothetical protein ACP5UA_05060 [Candidatus Hydrogenedens sp.]